MNFAPPEKAEPVAMQFLAMDCQAFVLRYSTAPSRFPVALMELASAVDIVRAHGSEWHVDSEKVVVCGFSAGGHLAACLCVFWNRDFLLKPLGLSGERVRPDGLILSYPVISSGEFAHEGSFDNLLGTQADVSLELHIFPEGRHGLSLANEETDKDTADGRGPFVVPCCQIWISLAREWLKRLDFPNIS